MSGRLLTVGAAQMGPITRNEPRAQVIDRMLRLLHLAHERGCQFIVFPELALTTFFPRWHIEDPKELESYFEPEMPGKESRRLFDVARDLRIGFFLGYAELAADGNRPRRFNSAILVDRAGAIVGKYRKVHLPGHADYQPARRFQHLEKRYFEPGDLGFPVWRTMGGVVGMCLCNDRRWPETYRVMALQGVDMVVLGYNTPLDHTGHPDIDGLSSFHNHLSMQAGAYQNATWVVGAAKCGLEEGSSLLGQSAIIAPSGEIVAMAITLDDELIVAQCDLDMGLRYKQTIFDFARHRMPEHYLLIVERRGAVPPPECPEKVPNSAPSQKSVKTFAASRRNHTRS